jgi:hypothetical protein
MRFRGEVYDRITAAHCLANGSGVANVSLDESVACISSYRGKVRKVGGIRNLVKIHHLTLRVFSDLLEDKIRSDETQTSGDEDAHTVRKDAS